MPCVWTHCINPPNATNGTNLFHNWDGEHLYDLRGVVEYTCAEGTWFEHNRDQEVHTLPCPVDGIVKEPRSWPNCVPSTLICHCQGRELVVPLVIPALF